MPHPTTIELSGRVGHSYVILIKLKNSMHLSLLSGSLGLAWCDQWSPRTCKGPPEAGRQVPGEIWANYHGWSGKPHRNICHKFVGDAYIRRYTELRTRVLHVQWLRNWGLILFMDLWTLWCSSLRRTRKLDLLTWSENIRSIC